MLQPGRTLVPAGAVVIQLIGGLKFTEGPVWVTKHGGYLVFSNIPDDKLKKWSPVTGLTTLRKPSFNANGNTLDHKGRLVTCEHGSRRVTLTECDGTMRLLADRFEGKRFNSPNDVVVKSDGTIWFTDPPYGLPKDQPRELEGNFVFRLDPNKNHLTVAASDFDMPNGLCFSVDEKRLYIADSGKPHHIRVFDVQPDGQLCGGSVFCVIEKGAPDGIRCDEHGNIWSTAGDGVHIFSPDGGLLQRIPVPETPANLCFGGNDGRTLFITARTSLYSIPVNVRGASR